ncbi:MAG: nitrate- and nitrite sensing domain-containing protein [Oceanicaulis sp.]
MSDDKLPWLGLILLAPLVALCLVTAQAMTTIAQTSTRIGSAEIAAEVAARAAVVMDDIQSERSNAAALRLSIGVLSEQQYRDRMASTDRTIANLLALADLRSGGLDDEAATSLEASLAGLARARALGIDTEASLETTVSAYTDVLKSFMDALALQLARTHAAERNFTTAFVLLARLHERVAIETSVGLTSFVSGEIDDSAHRVFLEAIAPQEALVQGFIDLMGAHWADDLAATLHTVDPARLKAARDALIAAGYGAALDTAHREFWREERLPVYFDLGVFRNRFAQDGVSEVLAAAQARKQAAVRTAALQILILLLTTGAAVIGFARLTGVKKPEDPAIAPDGAPAA